MKNFNLGSEVVKTAFKCTFSSILIIARQKDGGGREGGRKEERSVRCCRFVTSLKTNRKRLSKLKANLDTPGTATS